MPLPPETEEYRSKLVSLFKKADTFTSDDDELSAHWAAYLCVLTSGLMECGLKEVLSLYVETTSGTDVVKYVKAQLAKIQNPRPETILTTVGQFSSDWRDKIEIRAQGRIASSVGSVISNRHLIAHGKPVDLTLLRMRAYFDDCVAMLDLLNEHCTSAPGSSAIPAGTDTRSS
jgi:hypothetical protein